MRRSWQLNSSDMLSQHYCPMQPHLGIPRTAQCRGRGHIQHCIAGTWSSRLLLEPCSCRLQSNVSYHTTTTTTTYLQPATFQQTYACTYMRINLKLHHTACLYYEYVNTRHTNIGKSVSVARWTWSVRSVPCSRSTAVWSALQASSQRMFRQGTWQRCRFVRCHTAYSCR